ncbi:MAG: DUF393 domain-containing protein [Flavobacteriia bacterium]|nr:DUF393 domain-containing protein [Flavobacteriia bacterium]
MNQRAYIIFDGSCGLCNRAVLFVAKKDIKDIFLLVSSQSQLGKTFLKKYQIEGLEKSTVILISTQGHIHSKSQAVIYILKSISKTSILGSLLNVIPNFIRDLCYDVIAENRSWFVSKKSCEIPSPILLKKIILK